MPVYDIKNMSIWKESPGTERRRNERLTADIEILGLSVRSENALRRAGCHTVGDVLKLAGGEGEELLHIRNLGVKSRKEILDKAAEYRVAPPEEDTGQAGAVVRPGRRIWDHSVADYLPAGEALDELTEAGILQVKDLYRDTLREEPGWFAVRELFAGIHRAHFKDRYIGNTRLLFREDGNVS